MRHFANVADQIKPRGATLTASTSSANNKPSRILSGMRPTGRLHLGHFKGVLQNWLALQETHQCFFFAADWHALTTDYANPEIVRKTIWEMLIDWLAVGIQPEKAVIFIQSEVPEHAELHLLFSFMTPLSWLERVPTYKDQIRELREKDLGTYGFLGYPLLQAADILIYQADAVPVGEDQVPHVELTREVARRFNYLYRQGKPPLFPEPEALLMPASKLPGLDGRKMSKSYGNTIELAEEWKTTEKKVKTMPTDPARIRRTDAGNPEQCPVWEFHKVYSSEEERAWVREGCTTAGIGCLECKACLLKHLEEELQPIRARRAEIAARKDELHDIIRQGNERARRQASRTMDKVRRSLKMSYRV
ncbi:MAG: tryptophan--tRNA ligase [Zetaproteobacteria bacterium]|nr:MAG: tryptophan--tRNA ligase [Zetaproteobacteria bacterium]